MLRHLLITGVKALAASFFFGSLLIYGLSGLESPYINRVIWISVVVFCASWLLFAILSPAPAPHEVDIRDHEV